MNILIWKYAWEIYRALQEIKLGERVSSEDQEKPVSGANI